MKIISNRHSELLFQSRMDGHGRRLIELTELAQRIKKSRHNKMPATSVLKHACTAQHKNHWRRQMLKKKPLLTFCSVSRPFYLESNISMVCLILRSPPTADLQLRIRDCYNQISKTGQVYLSVFSVRQRNALQYFTSRFNSFVCISIERFFCSHSSCARSDTGLRVKR